MDYNYGYEALLGGPSKLHQAAPAPAPPSAPAATSLAAAESAASETAAPMEEDQRFQGMVNYSMWGPQDS